LHLGVVGLKALENGRLTPKQLEAMRRVITRQFHRTVKIRFYVRPEIAITKKPKEVRMGKGKGAVKVWVANIKAGRILVEVQNVTLEKANEVLYCAAKKLPIKTLLING